MPENYLTILISLIFASFVFIYFSINFAKKFDLLDYPNKRKNHSKPIPYTGGIGIAFCFLLIIILSEFNNNFLNLILSYSFLVAVAGFLDDKYHLNPGSKLLFQILPIVLLIKEGLYIDNLGEFAYFGTIQVGSFATIFTTLLCLLMINAFNYADGLDGFASSLFVGSIASILIITKTTQIDNNFNFFLISIIIPIIIFIIFNFGNKSLGKCFLGNSGSLMLGFCLCFILIYLKKILNVHPAALVWSVAILIYDFVFTNLNRIMNKRKVFGAGHDHFHYIIYKILKSKLQVSALGFLLHLVLGIFGFFLYSKVGSLISVMLFAIFFIFFSLARIKLTQIAKFKSK